MRRQRRLLGRLVMERRVVKRLVQTRPVASAGTMTPVAGATARAQVDRRSRNRLLVRCRRFHGLNISQVSQRCKPAHCAHRMLSGLARPHTTQASRSGLRTTLVTMGFFTAMVGGGPISSVRARLHAWHARRRLKVRSEPPLLFGMRCSIVGRCSPVSSRRRSRPHQQHDHPSRMASLSLTLASLLTHHRPGMT